MNNVLLMSGSRMKRGNTIVLLGDSIVLSNSTHPTNRGFFNWYNALDQAKYNVIYNAGVGGEGTAGILARVQNDVIAKNPAWCLIGAGVNDIASDVAATTIIANLTQMYLRLKAAKINVIGCTLLPSTSYDGNASRTATRAAVNAFLRDYALQNQGWFYLADVGDVYLDTGSAFAIPLAGYTSDGIHPNALGAGFIGQKMYTDLKDKVRVSNTPDYGELVVSASDSSIWTNSIWGRKYNALMSGTGGVKSAPATGSVANDWVVSVGGTWSKVARTDGKPGEWQQVILNSENQATFTAYDTANAVPGKTIWAEIEIETDETWTNITAIPLQLTLLQGSTVLDTANGLSYSSAGGSGTACINPRSAIIRTPNIVIPANCDKLRITFVIFASGGSCTLRLSRVCIRSLP